MTPYLILDNGMLDTLTRAAKSGIEVCIIMPHIPDKWYAFAVAKTYYRELIEAGVNIYEFTPGFVHAKVFVSDDDTATVGTVNLITGVCICILNVGSLCMTIRWYIKLKKIFRKH